MGRPFVKLEPDPSFNAGLCSAEVKQLLTTWSDLERALGEHDVNPEIEVPPTLFAKRIDGKIVWSRKDIEDVQRTLLESLASYEAQRVSDAIAKLVIWASIHCPEPASEALLTPADKLVLSALKDLTHLGIQNAP